MKPIFGILSTMALMAGLALGQQTPGGGNRDMTTTTQMPANENDGTDLGWLGLLGLAGLFGLRRSHPEHHADNRATGPMRA